MTNKAFICNICKITVMSGSPERMQIELEKHQNSNMHKEAMSIYDIPTTPTILGRKVIRDAS